MNKFFVAAIVAAMSLPTLSGCTSSQKQNVYQTGAVQQKMKVTLATAIDVREVNIEAKPSGVGAGGGAVMGGVLAAGGSGRSGLIAAVAGAIVGGIAGTVADRGVNAKKGQEIIYQIEGSSEVQALVQEVDDDPIGVGDRVRLIEVGSLARLTKVGKAAPKNGSR